MHWPIIGALIIALLGAGINFQMTWPELQGAEGSLSVHWAYQIFESHVYVHDGFLPNSGRLLLHSVLIFLLYRYSTQWGGGHQATSS